MSPRVRRLLHRTVHQLTHPRHAAGQAGRRALSAPDRRAALRPFRAAAAAGGVRRLFRRSRRLWRQPRGGDPPARLAGAGHGLIHYSRGIRMLSLRAVALCAAALLLGPPAQAEDWQLVKDEDGSRVYLSAVPGSKYKAYRGEVSIASAIAS